MTVGANTKEEMQDFVKLMLDKNLEFENRVVSEDGENLDTALFKYSGRFSVEDLETIKNVFGADKAEIGNDFVVIYLPESLQNPASF